MTSSSLSPDASTLATVRHLAATPAYRATRAGRARTLPDQWRSIVAALLHRADRAPARHVRIFRPPA